MCPACSLVNVFAIQVMKACVRVRLESSLEGLQMLRGGVRPCGPPSMRTIRRVPSVSPAGLSSRTYVQSRPVLVFPLPGASTGIGRVVGVQLAAGENMLLNRVYRIRQTKRMVDNSGCLAAQAAGVTSAMR